jgi:hypothetical protein
MLAVFAWIHQHNCLYLSLTKWTQKGKPLKKRKLFRSTNISFLLLLLLLLLLPVGKQRRVLLFFQHKNNQHAMPHLRRNRGTASRAVATGTHPALSVQS